MDQQKAPEVDHAAGELGEDARSAAVDILSEYCAKFSDRASGSLVKEMDWKPGNHGTDQVIPRDFVLPFKVTISGILYPVEVDISGMDLGVANEVCYHLSNQSFGEDGIRLPLTEVRPATKDDLAGIVSVAMVKIGRKLAEYAAGKIE